MIRSCRQCGTKNRVRGAHIARAMRCAKCKTPLGMIDEPIEADRAIFDDVVGQATVPVLVDFWAEWCRPCHMAAPAVQRVAQEMSGRAAVLKVNTERHPDIAARFDVRGIPNFAVFRRGKKVFQQAGVVSHAEMKRWLENAEREAVV
jgi:thioredoxin 2